MPYPLSIPDEVRADIAAHLRRGISEAVEDYWLASATEDALTAYLGKSLRQRERTVEVQTRQEVPRVWTWSMKYATLGSHGPKTAESYVGADGLFELTVDDSFSRRTKSLLFQAKKERDFSDRLLRQAISLLTWREAAIVIDYSPDAFHAFSVGEVILEKRSGVRAIGMPLDELLAERYLTCKIGDTALEYDAKRQVLSWKAKSDGRVAVSFLARHRFKILVEAHEPLTLIERDSIHNYRMDSTEEDILSVAWDASLSELKGAKKLANRILHLDGLNEITERERQILNRELQESNHAFDVLSSRAKARRAPNPRHTDEDVSPSSDTPSTGATAASRRRRR